MSEFEKGTRVRFIEDLSMGDSRDYFPAKGTEGIAEGSFCEYGDYHGVTVLFDDGRHIDVKEDYLEHVEDPYEYAIQRSGDRGDTVGEISEYAWSCRKTAENVLEATLHRWKIYGVDKTAKMVKRRKAGRIEDV